MKKRYIILIMFTIILLYPFFNSRSLLDFAYLIIEDYPSSNGIDLLEHLFFLYSIDIQDSAYLWYDAIYYVLSGGIFSQEPPVIPKDFVEENNEFAIDFYRQISENEGNLFFSPIGMYLTFSALYEGARWDTAEQIGNVFGMDPDDTRRVADIADVRSSIYQYDPYTTLDVANALWLFGDPDESYARTAKNAYSTYIESVGWNPEERINGWVSEKTRGKMAETFSSKDLKDASMVITNTAYFEGMWLTRFPQEDTVESDFWINSTSSVRAEFMKVHNLFVTGADDDGIRFIMMPYLDNRHLILDYDIPIHSMNYRDTRLSMLIIQPENRDRIDVLEKSLTSEKIEWWSRYGVPNDIVLHMPKFEIKAKYDLEPELKKLGMTDVFDKEGADLSGISNVTDGNLHVSFATQNAFVNISEDGQKSPDLYMVVPTIVPVPPPFRYMVDGPFIFIIRDNESGAILFMGRVSDPTM